MFGLLLDEISRKDLNKNITFNILNLPQRIEVAGKGTVSYQYDAMGNKLSRTVNETGQDQKVTIYLGSMIFENNVLQHVVPIAIGRRGAVLSEW
ncbi:hypothetical protein LQ567_06690 [Niabella pedocola]|uniref:Uncharacterized protein n=1 Tax=Niabella pedocola TaxID=1752077 RepID=A0ABS8PMX2_9BACT|nr:hypothetical protein [Niabella pedocola]MCD2422443.1 hypothetical protein [Niabella pedocola]